MGELDLILPSLIKHFKRIVLACKLLSFKKVLAQELKLDTCSNNLRLFSEKRRKNNDTHLFTHVDLLASQITF